MKTSLAILVGIAAGAAIAALLIGRHYGAEAELRAAEMAAQRLAWETDRARLESALKNARSRPALIEQAAPAIVKETVKRESPDEILGRLKNIRIGANQPRPAREAIVEFEKLIAAGPAALTAIRDFLARNEEVDYDLSGDIFWRYSRSGKIPTEFVLPPSLRLGLFEAVKIINGLEAQMLLTEVLSSTGRGAEVAYLGRVLQEMAPGKYRDAAVTAARDLLNNPVNNGPGALDQNDRSFLLGILIFFNDSSYARQAQERLIQPDGNIDRGLLNYLRQTLGEQAVPIAAQVWQDPRMTSEKKEPLASVALNYVGANAQADALFQTAVNDVALGGDLRRNLIESLSQNGFPNPKEVTVTDLPLIQKRLVFIEQAAAQATDPAIANAFDEVRRDLVAMQAQAIGRGKR
jgi:hypothetical protein